MKRHGHLDLEFPFANKDSEYAIDLINMKPEEYDIHIKGLLGLFVVLGKKILLTVSNSTYDNLCSSLSSSTLLS